MRIWTEKELLAEGYEVRNAQIKGVDLTMENHGCISFDVSVEGACWGCIFGGYSLGHGYLGAKEFSGYGPGMESIARIMDTVGVAKLSDLEGRYIRAAVDTSRSVKIIGNIINDKWFDIESFFKDAQKGIKQMSVKDIIVCIGIAFFIIQIGSAIAAKKSPLRHRNLFRKIIKLAMIAAWLCFLTIIALNFAE